MHSFRNYKLIILGTRSQVAPSVKASIARLAQSLHPDSVVRASDAGEALHYLEGPPGYVFVAGMVEREKLLQLCLQLRRQRKQVILVAECLSVSGRDVLECLELEAQGNQILRTDGAIALINSESQFVYAYPKAEVSASTVAICASTNRVLLVERAIEPYKGKYCLPSGFLRPLFESLEECAARELEEETGLALDPGELMLVTVQSAVDRDCRGHVIDHCYLGLVFGGIDPSALKAGDDAASVKLLELDQALTLALAADHSFCLQEAAKLYRESGASRTRSVAPFSRGVHRRHLRRA